MIDENFIHKWCRSRGYIPKIFGEQLRVVLFGEKHHDEEVIRDQKELVGLVNPPFLLHEFLDARIYDPFTEEISFHPDARLNEIDIENKNCVSPYLREIADKYKIKIIGIDLSDAETEIYIRRHEPYARLGLTAQSPIICKYREGRMRKRILEYCMKLNDNEILVAVAGAGHLMPSSAVHSGLKSKKISYAYIDQRKKLKLPESFKYPQN